MVAGAHAELGEGVGVYVALKCDGMHIARPYLRVLGVYPLGRPSLEEAHDVLLAALTSIVQGRLSGLFMEPGEIISYTKLIGRLVK